MASVKDGDSLEYGEKEENWMRARGNSGINSARPGNGERVLKLATLKEEPDVRASQRRSEQHSGHLQSFPASNIATNLIKSLDLTATSWGTCSIDKQDNRHYREETSQIGTWDILQNK